MVASTDDDLPRRRLGWRNFSPFGPIQVPSRSAFQEPRTVPLEAIGAPRIILWRHAPKGSNVSRLEKGAGGDGSTTRTGDASTAAYSVGSTGVWKSGPFRTNPSSDA
jgi:hypothetical protein